MRQPVFFTRKFPPSVGGMETLADGVWRALSGAVPGARLIAFGGPNSRLPLWLPGAVLRLLSLVLRRRVSFVLVGDALAYAVVSPLLRVLRVPHATMVMGLDLTFDNRLYRAAVHPWLRRSAAVLAISSATGEQAVGFGVPSERVKVIRLGVQLPAPGDRAAAGQQLRARCGLSGSDLVVVTLGRLVRRKGAQWFVAQVLPRLAPQVHYVLAGDGPEREAVLAAAASAGVADRVHLLGQVDDATRETVMRGADVFVQPNVVVPGDMEGFGLVTIEAAMRGTLVVAADLEGIKDAVVHGATGLLLPPADPDAWVGELQRLLADPAALAARGEEFAARTRELYSEQAMGRGLLAALELG